MAGEADNDIGKSRNLVRHADTHDGVQPVTNIGHLIILNNTLQDSLAAGMKLGWCSSAGVGKTEQPLMKKTNVVLRSSSLSTLDCCF